MRPGLVLYARANLGSEWSSIKRIVGQVPPVSSGSGTGSSGFSGLFSSPSSTSSGQTLQLEGDKKLVFEDLYQLGFKGTLKDCSGTKTIKSGKVQLLPNTGSRILGTTEASLKNGRYEIKAKFLRVAGGTGEYRFVVGDGSQLAYLTKDKCDKSTPEGAALLLSDTPPLISEDVTNVVLDSFTLEPTTVGTPANYRVYDLDVTGKYLRAKGAGGAPGTPSGAAITCGSLTLSGARVGETTQWTMNFGGTCWEIGTDGSPTALSSNPQVIFYEGPTPKANVACDQTPAASGPTSTLSCQATITLPDDSADHTIKAVVQNAKDARTDNPPAEVSTTINTRPSSTSSSGSSGVDLGTRHHMMNVGQEIETIDKCKVEYVGCEFVPTRDFVATFKVKDPSGNIPPSMRSGYVFQDIRLGEPYNTALNTGRIKCETGERVFRVHLAYVKDNTHKTASVVISVV